MVSRFWGALLRRRTPQKNRPAFLGEVFGDRRADSERLGALYRAVAERNGVEFIDIAGVAGPSPLDGLHFDREAHSRVATAFAEKVRQIFLG